MEEWKVLQDYATGKIKMQGSDEWISPTRTSNGRYLLELLPRKNENVLAVNLEDEPYVETPVIPEPGEYPDDMEPSYDAQLQDEARISEKEVQAAILAAEEVVMYEQSGRNKIFWELYVDQGSLSQRMAHQKTFKKLMCEAMPNHIWMSPPSPLWSTSQNLNCRTEAQKRELMRKRQLMARRQLDFVYEIFLMAVEMGIHATIEHPSGSAMWRRKPICDIPYYHNVIVNRCQTGLKALGDDGQMGPVRKQTTLRTTSNELYRAMSLPCCCQEPHVQMWGKSAALKEMQNYEPGFVNLAVKAIQTEMENTWAKRHALNIFTMGDLPHTVTDSQHDVEQMNKAVVRRVGRNAVLTIAKLHKQLGHPGRDRLLQAAKDSKLGNEVIAAARDYRCSVCSSPASWQDLES